MRVRLSTATRDIISDSLHITSNKYGIILLYLDHDDDRIVKSYETPNLKSNIAKSNNNIMYLCSHT